MTSTRKSARRRWSVASALALWTVSATGAPALECAADAGRRTARIVGEISGKHAFYEPVGPGWTFALEPAEFGWMVRLYDQDRLDLTQFTPPFRGAPNPRELFGWHLRNADNTGPNDGSVNAPQRRRPFVFAPDLGGRTGGFKPSDPMPPGYEPSPSDGRGLLEIVDIGLADLAPGQRARFTYLSFEVCLSWPDAGASAAATPAPRATFDPATVARFASCGLDDTLGLSAHLVPVVLDGDFDGDGTRDVAAPVARRGDGKRALAVCRGGNAVDVIGLAGTMGELTPPHFDRMDHWSVHPKGPVSQGAGDGDPPVLCGDAILIGIEEKSSVLLYRTPSAWAAYWQGD